MSTPDADDRREYYRIEDTLALDFEAVADTPEALAEAFPEASPLFNLLGELHVLEFESQHLLRQIGDRDRALASYLKVIDKRIDLIAHALARDVVREAGTLQAVTLSEGGINFRAAQAQPIGQVLALKLVLLPAGLGLQVFGRVNRCEPLADGEYEIGTVFEELGETQRQLLARHILQKQAAERREAKARNED